MAFNAAIAIPIVFIACCTSIVFLEAIIKVDPGCGILVTFLQFLFLAIEGFIFTLKFGTSKLNIPFRAYYILVTMFFAVNVSSNYALNLNIPMPLHLILQSGSLTANMLMSILILKRRYNLLKYLSVFLITLGIIICTIISTKGVKKAELVELIEIQDEDKNVPAMFYRIVGITLSIITLIVSARMRIYQEVLHKQYGQYIRETLFVIHLLPLPGFIFLWQNIWTHMLIASASPSMIIFGISLPIQWWNLIGNVLAQYVCISWVYRLTAEFSSLTVTLVTTLRKFVSIIFSILYFNYEFNNYHWLSTVLVFIGTILFTEIIPNVTKSLNKQQSITTNTSVVVLSSNHSINKSD